MAFFFDKTHGQPIPTKLSSFEYHDQKCFCKVMLVDVDHNDSDDRLAIILLAFQARSLHRGRWVFRGENGKMIPKLLKPPEALRVHRNLSLASLNVGEDVEHNSLAQVASANLERRQEVKDARARILLDGRTRLTAGKCRGAGGTGSTILVLMMMMMMTMILTSLYVCGELVFRYIYIIYCNCILII